MSYDISALKVLFKKIFPPKKSVYTVDTNGDGKADSILIKVLNVIMPIEVPEEIELGGFNSKNFDLKNYDLKDYGKIYLDNIPITVSKEEFDVETLKKHFLIFHRNEAFTIDDIIAGKWSKRIIALGDSIDIVIDVDETAFEILTEGKHTFKLDTKLFPIFEFEFELSKENLNQPFNTN